MKTVVLIAKELLGLFVDDAFLTAAVLGVVAAAAVMAMFANATSLWVGVVLLVGCICVLGMSVWRAR